MGSGTFNPTAYATYARSTRGKSVDEVFTNRSLAKELDPRGVKIRESRDSTDNPQSTPIIVALDVTGSMGMIAEYLAKEGLGTLFREVLDKKPVTDPHLMFMAVGDVKCDSTPFQVSQFEADNRIVEQLARIHVEGGGGGNKTESYSLPWYFASRHTEHDSFLIRGKRGYLFTIGDEEIPEPLTKGEIENITGDTPESSLGPKELLIEAQRTYDVYHIVIAQGDYASNNPEKVWNGWTKLMGQHVVRLLDYKKLSETIVAIIAMAEGTDAREIAKSYGNVVHDAVKNLPPTKTAKLLTA